VTSILKWRLSRVGDRDWIFSFFEWELELINDQGPRPRRHCQGQASFQGTSLPLCLDGAGEIQGLDHLSVLVPI
jgi:hypothetical protein